MPHFRTMPREKGMFACLLLGASLSLTTDTKLSGRPSSCQDHFSSLELPCLLPSKILSVPTSSSVDRAPNWPHVDDAVYPAFFRGPGDGVSKNRGSSTSREDVAKSKRSSTSRKVVDELNDPQLFTHSFEFGKANLATLKVANSLKVGIGKSHKLEHAS